MRPPALLFAVVLASSALAVACGNEEAKSPLSYTQDAKRAYDRAYEEFAAHNWLESQGLFRDVKRKYGYSRYAKLAELRIADADFEQDKFAEAIRGYRQFVHDHRADADDVGYARSRIAEAQYRQINESILLPTADERDQAAVLDAYRELRGYLSDYPTAKESDHVKALLAEVSGRLIRHELYVARFYITRSNFIAAVGRIEYALKNFTMRGPSGVPNARPQATDEDLTGAVEEAPSAAGGEPKGAEPRRRNRRAPAGPPPVSVESGSEAEALLLLGETFLKMKKYRSARASFEALLADYPTSGLVISAKNYLDFMLARGV